MPGYSGLNCTTSCPYPLYGYRCQGYCDCSNDTCDISTGCRTLTTGLCLKPSASIGELAGSTSLCSCLLPSVSYVETIGIILHKDKKLHLDVFI
uniref:Uncharacterized protein n=1 Tax=Magallana gigas TaxID=29159 RepID=K1P6M1_MAGGI